MNVRPRHAGEKITAGMATGRQGRKDGFPIARLRRWLLAGLFVLIAVLVGVLSYTRYRARRFLTDLPHRLGIDIKSETNGFTYSQTVKGRTVFTIHAAKAIQRENGKTTLHDVAITLYGPPGSNRTDTIRGAEFEYDQPNGVITAMGETHLDLALPTPAGAQPRPDAKRAQVTTSGLVFLQKLGVAATDQPIHLFYGDLHGDAIGADYESDTSVLRLRKDVLLDGVQNGRTIHVDAAAAEMDRTAQIATLHGAHVLVDKDRASGDTVVLALRKDGSVEAVNADGHASVQSEGGVHAEAPHLQARMNAAGKMDLTEMHGGVQLQADNGTGTSRDAVLRFGAQGRPVELQMQHAVELHGLQDSTNRASLLTADALVAQLTQQGTRTVLSHAVATGHASFHSTGEVHPPAGEAQRHPGAQAVRTTVVSAAVLQASTDIAGSQRYISMIDGTGGTRVEESDTMGNQRVSTGETLHAALNAPDTGKPGSGAETLKSAVQTGHVAVTQHTPATSDKAAQDSRATAERAEFTTATQRLLLTGSPVVTAPGVQLAAERITLVQGSGDANADGNVRGTFVQNSKNSKPDPVHVIADRAEIAGNSGLAHFYGANRPARMWSGTGQLQAAQIDLNRTAGTLNARAGVGEAPMRIVSLTLAAQKPAAGGAGKKAETTGVTEIVGTALQMTSATASSPGHVDVDGGSHLVSGTTEVTSGKLTATLRPSAKSNEIGQDGSTTVSAFNQGSIETITATDHVHLQQPGRAGWGERLLYTAAADQYQLTGTPSAPPRVMDSLRGNVTGTSLTFFGEDQSIEVAGEQGRPVRTETEARRSAHSR